MPSALSRSGSNLRLFCEAVCVNLLKLDIKNMDELSATNPISCDGICGKEAKGCGLFYAPPAPSHCYPVNICQVHNSAHQETFLCSCMVFFQYFLKIFYFVWYSNGKKKIRETFFLYESKIEKSKNVNKLFLSNSRICKIVRRKILSS